MARWAPLKRDTLDSLCGEFLQHYSKGRTIIAVDGAADARTARFADDFAERLGKGSHAVFRASLGDFHLPEGGYDLAQFRRVLVEPFRLAGSTGFVLAAFDAERGQPREMEWTTGPQDATLVVDGAGLLAAETRGLWNWSIALDLRDADRGHAGALVDNRDPDHPRRVFADSC